MLYEENKYIVTKNQTTLLRINVNNPNNIFIDGMLDLGFHANCLNSGQQGLYVTDSATDDVYIVNPNFNGDVINVQSLFFKQLECSFLGFWSSQEVANNITDEFIMGFKTSEFTFLKIVDGDFLIYSNIDGFLSIKDFQNGIDFSNTRTGIINLIDSNGLHQFNRDNQIADSVEYSGNLFISNPITIADNSNNYHFNSNYLYVASNTMLYKIKQERCFSVFSPTFKTGIEPLTVNFYRTAKSFPEATALYSWDFENDGIFDAIGHNVEHTYDHANFYSVKLVVSNETVSDTLIIDDCVNVQLSAPVTPKNLQIDIEEGNSVLSWIPSDSTIAGTPIVVDYYLVYNCENLIDDSSLSFHGFTSDTTYTHFGAADFSENMFYRVESFIGSDRELENYIEIIYEHENYQTESS